MTRNMPAGPVQSNSSPLSRRKREQEAALVLPTAAVPRSAMTTEAKHGRH